MARQKAIRRSTSPTETRSASKRPKEEKCTASTEDPLVTIEIDIDKDTQLDNADADLRKSLRQNLRTRFRLASHLLPLHCDILGIEHEKSAYRVSETILTLCSVLNLSHAVTLTALVYLQMYKNSSMSCILSTSQSEPGQDYTTPSEMKRHEKYLIAAACILLAWKYREDDTRVAKSTRKIFEFASVLYKVYVAQSENSSGTPSVSGWMLQDEGNEINKLKSQLIEQESHLLQALDYHVGPVALPHKLIPAYVRKFLIAIACDISDLHDLALKLDNLVGMLVLDCYKTQICLDYTPGEILVSCVFKATCLLTVAGLCSSVFTPNTTSYDYFNHVIGMEDRLMNFLTMVGTPVIEVCRVLECLSDIRHYSQLFKDC